ncbi:MAG: fibronectin type III domain-containing protein [Candidatus Acidiferrales bacterium]
MTDLAAQQSGAKVVLTFTLPTRSTEGKSLAQFPEVEIYRGYAPAGAAPSQVRAPEQLIYTVPSALVETYLIGADAEGPPRLRFEDPVQPEDLQAHGSEEWVYAVRTRARADARRNSAPSNVVALRVLPVPPAVTGLRATVTEAGVELTWTAAAPSASQAVVGYRVYRALVAEGKEKEALAEPAKAELAAPRRLRAVAPLAEWSDAQIEWGRGYIYTVHSVAQHGAESVESADSEPVVVAPRDTFAPSAPVNLVGVPVPATAETPAHVELSWRISAEMDLAGYTVYRSDGTSEEKITPELLPTPAFRDTWLAPGRRYSWRVTATDRAGNESARSQPVSESVPSP